MRMSNMTRYTAPPAGVLVIYILYNLVQFIRPTSYTYPPDSAPAQPHVNIGCPDSRRQYGVVAEEEHSRLEETARAVYAKRGVVALVIINNAYLPLALSWCCNTAGMAGVHESVLLLTTDTPSALRLRALFPALTVFSLDTSDYDGAQEWGRAGYVRLMVERTCLMHRLLEAGVRLLLFEVDCLWLSDPVPALLARHRDDTDIIATVISGKGDKTAGGFLLLNPSEATLKVWSALTQRMVRLYDSYLKNTEDVASFSTSMNDQEFLFSLVQMRYAGVKVLRLPLDLYPDGKWYASHTPGQPLPDPRPVIINNNWVVGNQVKVGRAKAYGHWFWDDTAEKCNATALNNLFH